MTFLAKGSLTWIVNAFKLNLMSAVVVNHRGITKCNVGIVYFKDDDSLPLPGAVGFGWTSRILNQV